MKKIFLFFLIAIIGISVTPGIMAQDQQIKRPVPPSPPGGGSKPPKPKPKDDSSGTDTYVPTPKPVKNPYSDPDYFKNGYGCVDLGLPSRTLWATCNLGTNNPINYGDYYAWGETSTKRIYTEGNSTTNRVRLNDISGGSYDVAHVKMGDNWCLPSLSDWKELFNNCSIEVISQKNNTYGYKLTGPNGKSIYLPGAGSQKNSPLNVGWEGFYWTSTPTESNLSGAYLVDIYEGETDYIGTYRYIGTPIRPVYKTKKVRSLDETLEDVHPNYRKNK